MNASAWIYITALIVGGLVAIVAIICFTVYRNNRNWAADSVATFLRP